MQCDQLAQAKGGLMKKEGKRRSKMLKQLNKENEEKKTKKRQKQGERESKRVAFERTHRSTSSQGAEPRKAKIKCEAQDVCIEVRTVHSQR